MDIKSVKPTFAQDARAALNKESGSSGSPSLMEQFVIRTMNDDLKKVSAQPAPESTGAKVASRSAQLTIPHAATQNEPYGTAPAMDMKTAPVATVLSPAQINKKEPEKKEIKQKAREAEDKARKTKEAEQKKLKTAAKEAKIKLAQEQKEAKRAAEQAAKKAALEAKAKAEAEKKKIIDARNARKQELERLFKQANLKLRAKEFDLAITEAQKIVDNEQASWFAKWRAERLINKAQKQRQNEIASAKPIIKMPLPTINATAIQNKTDIATEPAPLKPTEPSIFASRPGTPAAVAPLNLPTIEVAPIKITEPSTTPRTEQKPAAPRGEELSAKPIATWPKEPQKINEPMPAVPAPARPLTASVPLLARIKLERITKPTADEAEFDIKKILLFGFGSLAILALIISGLWYFLKQPGNIAQISQSPSPRPSLAAPAPAIMPISLFKTDSRKIFELKLNQEKNNFQEAIASLDQTEEPAGNFIYILFKDAGGNWPSLDKLASSTGIDIFDLPTQSGASTIREQVNMNSFSFFAYSQSQNGSGDSPFNAFPTTSGRMGLVVKINSASVDQLAKSLKDLEQLMLPDLKILIPATNNMPANPIFSTNVYKNINIRYVNLPDSDLSFDYAVLNDKLIFATSKVSMYAIIDRILNSSNQPAAQPEIP